MAVFPDKCPACEIPLEHYGVTVNGIGALPETLCDNDHDIIGKWETRKDK